MTPSDYRLANKVPNGFTLVEVLVAAVILFSSLTLAAVAYNHALDFVQRSMAVIHISKALPAIRQQVAEQLQNGITAQETRFSDELLYTWQAELENASMNVTGAYDEYTGDLEYGSFYLQLYRVVLTVQQQDPYRVHTSRYDYQELVWRHPET